MGITNKFVLEGKYRAKKCWLIPLETTHIVSPYYVTLDEVFYYSWQMRAGDKFVYQFFSVIPGNILLLLFCMGNGSTSTGT